MLSGPPTVDRPGASAARLRRGARRGRARTCATQVLSGAQVAFGRRRRVRARHHRRGARATHFNQTRAATCSEPRGESSSTAWTNSGHRTGGRRSDGGEMSALRQRRCRLGRMIRRHSAQGRRLQARRQKADSRWRIRPISLCEKRPRRRALSSTTTLTRSLHVRRRRLDRAVRSRRPRCAIAFTARTLTYSPKVFLPVTNLCRDRCTYCTFRRDPGDAGEWTMSPDEIARLVASRPRARLHRGADVPRRQAGDRVSRLPPRSSKRYGAAIDGRVRRASRARSRLPRACCRTPTPDCCRSEEMAMLRPLNVSMGLMLENVSRPPARPRHAAPITRPTRIPARACA